MIGLIDVGGTKLLAAVAAREGAMEPAIRRLTPPEGDPLDQLVEMLEIVRRGRALSSIGLAVPGPFDREAGRLVDPPGMPQQWHGLDIAGRLGDRFQCPVRLENDANCAALAEARLGAGRQGRMVVYYTVSTGIGTGMVRDGRLVVERDDSEGGHQVLWPRHLGGPQCHCGGWGCLEAIASGRSLAVRLGRPTEEVDDQEVWQEVGTWLGLAVVNTVALLDCDCVVFGGGVAVPRWPLIEPALRATVGAHLKLQPAPAIQLAELGDDRNLAGMRLLLTDGGGGAPDRAAPAAR